MGLTRRSFDGQSITRKCYDLYKIFDRCPMRIPWALTKDLIIPALGLLGINGFVGSWLLHQYTQPQVVYYTDEYYSRLKDFSVGSIFIVNEGRTPDTNLSVSIGEKILASDISIAYVSDKATVVHEKSNRTRITIPRLKPRESAEIVFLSHSEKDTFSIDDITSDSGNIRHEEWTRPWWYFTKLQGGIILGIVVLATSIASFAGYLLSSWNTRRKTTNQLARARKARS